MTAGQAWVFAMTAGLIGFTLGAMIGFEWGRNRNDGGEA